MSIKVLLADDHKIIRDGLRSLIERHPEMEVVGEAQNGRTTVQLARELEPDIIIMDISMPDLNGIDATRQIVADAPDVKVIALSMHSDKRFVVGMFKAGAAGYLLKDCAFDELERNVISGYGLDGVRISSGSEENVVAGNYIGTNADGDTAIPNGDNGVYVSFCASTASAGRRRPGGI